MTLPPGQMMDVALSVTTIMRHAARLSAGREIISVTAESARHRYRYQDLFRRAARLANAFGRRRIDDGTRVGTLAWNDHRHLEIYYAVSCSGAICHTINPRLFPAQLEYIINHAGDRILFVDPSFAALIVALAPRLTSVELVVWLTAGAPPVEQLPIASVSYEALIEGEADEFEWRTVDERMACSLCYTSGTTGHPKGVLYSHRSTILHAYACLATDALGISQRDTVMPVVPMFHVNAWGTPYSALMAGAKLVLPGPKMGDAVALHELILSEGVTIALAVPTVWLNLLAHLEATGGKLGRLRKIVSGGSAVPPAMIEAFEGRYGVVVQHGWGMTEMSPVGTLNSPIERPDSAAPADGLAIKAKQGRPLFGVDLEITDANGRSLPWNGTTSGALRVRSPWACSRYFGATDDADSQFDDGWFVTGDMATIDGDGYLQITDRTKDVVKSGGEWISTIELESIAMGHPAVAEAAVIAVPHPKWLERPLLVVVRKPQAAVAAEELLARYEGRVASWWIPDAVAFVTELPHTATGKVSKRDLRQQFAAPQPNPRG